MSYVCEFCGLRHESCACSVDLTEPRLESELAVSDNMMAVENSDIQKPYGLLDAPSPSDFFSLLVELEKQETDAELGPLPKWMNHSKPNKQPICNGPIPTTPIKTKPVCPTIPKLERQTNMPPEIIFSHDDLQDLSVELFPEEDELPIIDYCETCCDFSCECDKMFPCQCGAFYHIDEPYQMCCNCEMAERQQDLIDQQRYPDDIPDRYRYDSD